MVRASNFVVGLLNALVVLVSLAAVGASVYFRVHGSPTSCQKSLQDPLLVAGLALLAVSLMAVVGACFGVNWLLRLYLALMLVLIVALVALAAFLFLVTNKGAGQAVSGRGYREYRLGDYSHWLQNHVASGKRWDEIRVAWRRETSAGASRLAAPLGCCKPPSDCGFEFKNATYWTLSPGSGTAVDGDCAKWSNDPKILCYNCNSCKAGFLASIKRQWRALLVFNVCIVVVVLFVYSVGCCAARNNRSDGYKFGRRGCCA
ncbi:tetraspanin-11 [Eucalyptus grandis]|uniref:tetraspanin-11 n=1 Tax=Eucalyptus grandis TaxID=71139 RepID=UPI00192EA240|nr:tetraspanin-11 [Eucalyptus grandis]